MTQKDKQFKSQVVQSLFLSQGILLLEKDSAGREQA